MYRCLVRRTATPTGCCSVAVGRRVRVSGVATHDYSYALSSPRVGPRPGPPRALKHNVKTEKEFFPRTAHFRRRPEQYVGLCPGRAARGTARECSEFAPVKDVTQTHHAARQIPRASPSARSTAASAARLLLSGPSPSRFSTVICISDNIALMGLPRSCRRLSRAPSGMTPTKD